jgi:hypothetical protein
MSGVSRDEAEVCRLYVEAGLSTKAIGVLLGSSESIVRRRLIAAGIERRPSGQARFARRDFGGDRLERAYLLGFRSGDLNVELRQTSVVVKCTSTRAEQVALFTRLFEPYGHVYPDEATMAGRLRQSVGMQVILNRSFEFLLPKRGIGCPRAALCVPAGYTNRYGVRSNGDPWRLGIGRADALHRLFTRIDPDVRHARRRRDMEHAWATAKAKLADPSVARRLWAVTGREPSPARRE